MTRAGEEGGGLPDALAVVSEQMERMYQLKKKIKEFLYLLQVDKFAMSLTKKLLSLKFDKEWKEFNGSLVSKKSLQETIKELDLEGALGNNLKIIFHYPIH